MQQPDLQRIEHIKDYCVEINETINRYGRSFDTFAADMDYQKSVSFSILQVGELSGKLSESFRKETSADVPWSAIKGMRNLFAHNYGSMSREVIWKTANEDIAILLAFCERILRK
mgnify:CR=1 FL=1